MVGLQGYPCFAKFLKNNCRLLNLTSIYRNYTSKQAEIEGEDKGIWLFCFGNDMYLK